MLIDPEFKKLMHPLKREEYELLRESIEFEGCRDPLCIWKEENILLDGHNRYEICQELGQDFETILISLPNRESAFNWIINNQLGRRNCTKEEASYLRGKQYQREKNTHGGDRRSSSDKNCHLKTAEKLADQYKVHPNTIKNDGKYAEAIDLLTENVGEEFKNKVLTREMDLTQKEVVELAKLDSETQRKIVENIKSGEVKSLLDAKRKAKKDKAKEAKPLEGKYRVIYADPPWKYNNSGIIGSDNYGHVERHYPVMSIGELCNMNIKDITEDNAVLFLWVTSPFLEDAFRVVGAWGFAYKSSFIWDKVKHNFGHYNSVRHEFLLIAIKGSCTPDIDEKYDSVISIERSDKHSEKPEHFRQMIDKLYPYGNRIELFARGKTENWDVWGNEIEPSKL